MFTVSSVVRPALVGVAALSLALLGAAPAHAAGVPGDDGFLDTASEFSVIGGSTVTNTGPSVLDKSLAVSPGTATTGFPPGLYGGELHSADADAIQAQLDVTTAANAIMAVPSYDVGSADLDGQVFKAGAYSSGSSLLNAGTITLDGDADDVFIFTAVSSLTMMSGSTILFTGGAQECNVFWRIGSSATIGSGAHFAGTVIAQASVTANTLATISGRLFAQTAAVTLQSNVFTAPTCDTSGGNGDYYSDVVPVEGETPTPGTPGVTPPIPSDEGPTGPVLPVPEEETPIDETPETPIDETPETPDTGGGVGEGTPGTTAVPTLAATGFDAAPVLLTGFALLGVGGVLLVARPRRRA